MDANKSTSLFEKIADVMRQLDEHDVSLQNIEHSLDRCEKRMKKLRRNSKKVNDKVDKEFGLLDDLGIRIERIELDLSRRTSLR